MNILIKLKDLSKAKKQKILSNQKEIYFLNKDNKITPLLEGEYFFAPKINYTSTVAVLEKLARFIFNIQENKIDVDQFIILIDEYNKYTSMYAYKEYNNKKLKEIYDH